MSSLQVSLSTFFFGTGSASSLISTSSDGSPRSGTASGTMSGFSETSGGAVFSIFLFFRIRSRNSIATRAVDRRGVSLQKTQVMSRMEHWKQKRQPASETWRIKLFLNYDLNTKWQNVSPSCLMLELSFTNEVPHWAHATNAVNSAMWERISGINLLCILCSNMLHNSVLSIPRFMLIDRAISMDFNLRIDLRWRCKLLINVCRRACCVILSHSHLHDLFYTGGGEGEVLVIKPLWKSGGYLEARAQFPGNWSVKKRYMWGIPGNGGAMMISRGHIKGNFHV